MPYPKRDRSLFLAGKKKQVLGSLRKLCRDKYVSARELPPALRRKSIKYFGTIRKAKWEACIIKNKPWTRREFLERLRSNCKCIYCDANSMSPRFTYWAKYFCGSVRAAKWEARIINDHRIQIRHKSARSLSKEDVLNWVRNNSAKKSHEWPAHIIYHAVMLFKSTRGARLAAGAIKDERKSPRKP